MQKQLFVGNIPYNWDDHKLHEVFSQIGAVVSAKVIRDKYSSRSRGFGFVEMSSLDEAKKAIESINGKEYDSRALIVNEARLPEGGEQI